VEGSLLRRHLPALAKVCLVGMAYFAAARLSLALAIPPGYATAVWPPSGIAVAAALLLGHRVWPGIWLGAALANLTVEASLVSATLIASGNTLEALLAAALMRQYAVDPREFLRAEDVVKFVLLAALGASVAATAALLPLVSVHDLSLSAALRNWWTWWQGDVAGIVLVAPLVLSWTVREAAPWPAQKKIEAAAFALLLIATALAISSDGASHFVPFSLAFVALPFIIWAAIRFGQREVTTAIAVVCGVAVWYTVERPELFGPVATNELLLMLLAFISMVVATGLMLAAELGARRRATDELQAKRAELESQVQESANYDALTRLPNPALFRSRLAQLLDLAGDNGRKIAVAVLDIQRFKTLNDTFGRRAGDELLKQIAGRMSLNLGAGNLLARAPGDRFALAAHGFRSENAVARAVGRVLERWFGEPYALAGSSVLLSARMGLALYPDDGKDPDTLFLHAESALKKAKAADDRFLFYTQSMSERVAEKLSLEHRMRAAVEREQFVLHYQPRVNVDTRQVVGLEALIRWRTADGLVLPVEFIPALEETGLIVEWDDGHSGRRCSIEHCGRSRDSTFPASRSTFQPFNCATRASWNRSATHWAMAP